MVRGFVSGWDGGGTKTQVVCMDEDGRELDSRFFGPINLNGTAEDVVRRTVREATAWIRGAQEAAGMPCLSTVIGLAGISNLQATDVVSSEVRAAGLPGQYRIVGDQEIALAGALEGHGAVLIAGTGSICFGRDPEGTAFRVGGYGYLIDDPGSGYAIGRDILTGTVRAADGRDAPTCLKDMVYRTLNLRTVSELISWVYAPGTGKKEIAALARLLPQAMEQGDEMAIRIARRAADDLAELALTAWRKTGMTDGELALTGSILTHSEYVRSRVISAFLAHYPKAEVGFPKADPAHGAVKLAVQLLDSAG